MSSPSAAVSVRLVLFDIDGTLVSTGGAGMKAFGEAFEAAFGIAEATAKIKFAGRTDYSIFRELLRTERRRAHAGNRESFSTTTFALWTVISTQTRAGRSPAW